MTRTQNTHINREEAHFCGDDELVHFEGRTYAFLNQWGGRVFDEAMAALRDAFPENDITFAPTE